MALTGKYISLKAILEKIFRDYRGSISPDDLYVEEALEWTGEALGLLGVSDTFEDTVSEITVNDYYCTIPTGLLELNFMRLVDSNVPIYKSTDLMYNSSNTKFLGVCYTYKENNDKYYFNFEDGDIEVSYKKYVTDTFGPMIPDDDTFRCYVSEYIAFKTLKRIWRLGKIPDKVMNDCERELAFYTRRATSRGLMPSPAMMDNLKNMTLRLLPNINNFDTAFGTLSIQGQRPLPTVK